MTSPAIITLQKSKQTNGQKKIRNFKVGIRIKTSCKTMPLKSSETRAVAYTTGHFNPYINSFPCFTTFRSLIQLCKNSNSLFTVFLRQWIVVMVVFDESVMSNNQKIKQPCTADPFSSSSGNEIS